MRHRLRIDVELREPVDDELPVIDRGGLERPKQRLEGLARRHLQDEPPRGLLDLARLFRLRRGEDLREPRLGARQPEGEEDGGGRAHGRLRLRLRLGQKNVEGVGVLHARQHLRSRIAQGPVGTEEEPDDVARAQAVRRGQALQELVALLGRGELLVRQTLDGLSEVGGEKRHWTSAF